MFTFMYKLCVIKNIEHQVHKSNIKISGCKQTVRGSMQINQFLKMLINRFIRDESIIKCEENNTA